QRLARNAAAAAAAAATSAAAWPAVVWRIISPKKSSDSGAAVTQVKLTWPKSSPWPRPLLSCGGRSISDGGADTAGEELEQQADPHVGTGTVVSVDANLDTTDAFASSTALRGRPAGSRCC
ncbi:hypothetical protein Vafri_20070, partial [Volvox africanus]